MRIRLFSLLAVVAFATLGSGCMMFRDAGTKAGGGGGTGGDDSGDVIGKDWSDGKPIDTDVEEVGDRRWGPINFGYDQSTIGVAERPKLKAIYEYLRDNSKFDLLIEGHCDERGSEEYNRTLGERRAIAVRDYLVKLGLSKSRVQTLSFGEERPVTSGSGEAAFQKNRRAELVVISAKKAAAVSK